LQHRTDPGITIGVFTCFRHRLLAPVHHAL
jgi:hypothetical protein